QQRLGITTIMVTHDQEEALTMADRIVVMQAGRIAQVGTARALYDRPASRFVAEFIGRMNLLTVARRDGRPFLAGLPLALPEGAGAASLVGIRPEDLHILTGEAARRPGLLPARLRNGIFLGNLAHLVLTLGDEAGEVVAEVVAEVPGHAYRAIAEAAEIAVELPPEAIKVLG